MDSPSGKVMVVDDDRFFLTVLGDFVSDHLNMRPVLVQDGAVALSMLAAESPDLVLLDIIMPGMDGLEVLRGIKSQRPELPVIMVTSTSLIDHAIAALREGADDFVRKPVDLDALGHSVERVLHKGVVARMPVPIIERGADRRKSVRVRTDRHYPAQLQLMDVILIDISLAGALVEHTDPVRPGEIYRLTFKVNGRQVQVLARAIRVFASHRVASADGERRVVYRTGMEFVGVEKEAADLISGYVKRLIEQSEGKTP